jgi:ion channel POLLUX/CASTOR
MKYPITKRLLYRFELFLSKGGTSVFMMMIFLFLLCFLIIAGLRFVLLKFFMVSDFSDSFWVTFLQMTDPGSMSLDNSASFWPKSFAILAGIAGIVVLSMLIAVLTTSLETLLYNFRKGRGEIIETNHTLILGWNERIVDLIKELIVANESERKACIVVLSEVEKETMDDLITKRIQDTKTTRIITSNGSISNINELKRVNAEFAKSIIIFSNCSENSSIVQKANSDIRTIKTIMAIIALQNGKNSIPVIIELFTKEKKEIVNNFMDSNIIEIDSWDIMGRLLTQTSLTSGLEVVYNEILSFDGCEIYFHKEDWGNINFYDLVNHFKDGIPLGIHNETEGFRLHPPKDTQLTERDELVILADDDSSIKFSHKRLYRPNDIEKHENSLVRTKKKILILGWHFVANIIIREAHDYLLEETEFTIVYDNPSDEFKNNIEELKNQFNKFEISLVDANALNYDNLIKTNPNDFDNIFILSQNLEENNPDKIDSDTLIILLLLRNIIDKNNNVKIITQVLNSDNQELINQTDIDDFIISNKLITMMLAQLSENPLVKKFYDDIFSEDGSEIYIKPVTLYFKTFPVKLTFMDIIQAGYNRYEICIGIQNSKNRKDINLNFGVELNLPKDKVIELTENDYLITLSEDEL